MRNRARIATVIVLVATLALALPAMAGWTNVANLPLERAGHASVTMPDGRVLVSGGCWGWKDRFTADCVLYDPASNTWIPAGAMSAPRSEHGLVVLQSGKVLAIGGFYKDGEQEFYLASCDLYDPASNTWAPTGSMATSRTVFSTVLLNDGKVLVAGGLNKNPSGADEYLAGAELYDPATGTWSATASLTQSRSAHTGTLLQNGKVLVAGGAMGFTPVVAAELYDPASGTWSYAGGNATPHAGHSATLLADGKVLVAGGASGFSIGNTCEVYDPATRGWSATGSMIGARALHIAVRLNSGKVLVAGGGNGFTGDVLKNPIAEAEIYDPGSGAWSATDPMPFTRSTFTGNLLADGRVLVAGGLWYDGTNYFARRKADIYTPAADGCTVTCDVDVVPTSGPAPLAVNFAAYIGTLNCSENPSYAWTFGDGGTSTIWNPSHTYTAPGTYTWSITGTANGVSCSQTGTVTVTQGGSGKPGDCNGDDTVSIGEVQKAINMFLGIAAVECGVDCNGDGSVSIGEVQKVINCFLGVATSC